MFLICNLKHEIGRKTLLVPFHLLIEAHCAYSIQPCQISIQYYPLPSQYQDGACNRLDGHQSLLGPINCIQLIASKLVTVCDHL